LDGSRAGGAKGKETTSTTRSTHVTIEALRKTGKRRALHGCNKNPARHRVQEGRDLNQQGRCDATSRLGLASIAKPATNARSQDQREEKKERNSFEDKLLRGRVHRESFNMDRPKGLKADVSERD